MIQEQIASPRGQYFPIAVDPVAEFKQAMADFGLVPDQKGIVDDDTWQECWVKDSKGKLEKAGRYILKVNPDGFAYGYLYSHKGGGRGEAWHSKGCEVTPIRRASMEAQKEKRKRAADAEKAEKLAHSMRTWIAADYLVSADPSQPDRTHGYLIKKKIHPIPGDVKLQGDMLMVPASRCGEVVCYQRIFPDDRGKKLCAGFDKSAYYVWKGSTETVAIAEGWATAFAVHASTGWTVYTAWDAGNLARCATDVRAEYPDAAIIIAGDNDKGGTGQRSAHDAAKSCKGRAIWPSVEGQDWWDVWDQQGANTVLDALSLDGETKEPEIELDPYGYSDDALAVELGRRGWDEDAKFVPQWGKWLFWDGSRWVRDERLSSHSRIRKYMTDRARDYEMWGLKNGITEKEIGAKKQQMRSAGKISAVESLARSNPKSAALHDDFDCDLMLMGTPKGTVDLRNGKLRPSRREDMLTKTVAVSPAPEGTKPVRWLEFLDQVFDGDQETIAFMKRIAGYSLTGMTTEHRLFFLSGTGANGKSVFLNTLTGMMGDYAQRSSAETFLLSYGDKHSTSTAALQGARMVVGSELPKGRQWNDAIIKDLTGGDRMRARFMRQDEFEFTPQLTLLIAGNTKPSFGAVDEAMRRRVVLIPFDVTIPAHKRDPDLPSKLEAEWPAILRWAIEGAIEWQRMGLAIPASIEAASADYMDGEDEIGQFIQDRTITDVSAWVSRGDLIQAYKSWCFDEQVDEMSRGNFYKAIEERRYRRVRRTGTDGFSGLRIA